MTVKIAWRADALDGYTFKLEWYTAATKSSYMLHMIKVPVQYLILSGFGGYQDMVMVVGAAGSLHPLTRYNI